MHNTHLKLHIILFRKNTHYTRNIKNTRKNTLFSRLIKPPCAVSLKICQRIWGAAACGVSVKEESGIVQHGIVLMVIILTSMTNDRTKDSILYIIVTIFNVCMYCTIYTLVVTCVEKTNPHFRLERYWCRQLPTHEPSRIAIRLLHRNMQKSMKCLPN